MRRIHCLLAATALIGAPLAAQTAPVPAPAPAAAANPAVPAPTPVPSATVDADPALWVVKDADTTIYMLGTVHVLKPGLGWFDEAVRTAFDASDEVMLEIVMPEDEAAAAAAMGRRGVDTSGVPLTQKLPEAVRPRYAAALQAAGMPANALDRLKPWFASTILTLLPLGKLGYDPASGVEKQVTAAAKAAGKPVGGLETIDQQLGYFDAIPEKAQVAMLASVVEEYDQVGPTLDKMVDAWAKGEPERLATLMNEQMKETPDVARILLTDRNARWADWIRTRLDTPGTVFMAVGAGHLAGPQSVQEALKARGLTAARVAY